MSTNQDGTTANGRAKAFLTTFVCAPTPENPFLAVILAFKDGFETFLGARNGGTEYHFGPKINATNRDQTAANGRVKTFLTTFVWASRSENAFLAVILAVKDVFETFWGPIMACMECHFGPKFNVNQSRRDHRQWKDKRIPNNICMCPNARKSVCGRYSGL
jgi:hypothetical protein